MSLSQDEINDVGALLARYSVGPERELLLRGLDDLLIHLNLQTTPFNQVVSDLHTLLQSNGASGTYPAARYLRNGAARLTDAEAIERLLALAERVSQGPVSVLYMNARSPAPWQSIYPGARGIDLTEPGGRWHASTLPGSPPWHDARRAIDHGLAQLTHRPGRIAVFASTGYALGAYLGNRVQQFAQNRIHFHQYTGPRGPAGGWVDYGPAGGASMAAQSVLVRRDPAGGGDGRHIALVWEVTHRGKIDEITPGLRDCGCPDAVIERIGMPEPARDAVPDARSVIDRIVDTLDRSVEAACARPGVEAVHLFPITPLALVMRAAERFHVLPRPLIIHERGPGDRYRPALRFARGAAELLGG